VSDNSIPTSSDGQQPTPPPAAPPAPPYAASSQTAPAYPQAPSYPAPPSYSPPPAQTQAYPGAPPSPAQPGNGMVPAQPAYGQPTYGAPAYGAPSYGAPAPVPQPGAYQAYPASIYPAARPASGLAITSLVCGIAGVVFGIFFFWVILPFISSVVAIITGHAALRKTKSDPSVGGRGMAFAGLIMGYIMAGFQLIGLVVVIFSFLFLGAFSLPFVFAT
jgi:hypothetical protein